MSYFFKMKIPVITFVLQLVATLNIESPADHFLNKAINHLVFKTVKDFHHKVTVTMINYPS